MKIETQEPEVTATTWNMRISGTIGDKNFEVMQEVTESDGDRQVIETMIDKDNSDELTAKEEEEILEHIDNLDS